MSEFKFACPVCGQHITAASSSSGTQIGCPTCFQKIIVPQAPESGETKLIVSAAQAAKPRPGADNISDLGPLRRRGSRGSLIATGLFLILLCTAAGALYSIREDIARLIKRLRPAGEPSATNQAGAVTSIEPAAPDLRWTMDLSSVFIPETPVAGKVRGSSFKSDEATLTGGALSLRQGPGWPPDLGVAVLLPVQRAEDLTGKTILVARDGKPPVPRVIVRWKDEQRQPKKEEITGGYALEIIFVRLSGGRMSGKIYLAVPDASNSVVAGTFEAQIRQAAPGKN